CRTTCGDGRNRAGGAAGDCQRLPARAPGLLAAQFVARHGGLRSNGIQRSARNPAVMLRAIGLALVFCGVCEAQTPAQGVPQAAPDAMALLRKIYQATEKLSYSGTFVYQQGDRTETSRIDRVAG